MTVNSIDKWMTPLPTQLVLRFNPVPGGVLLEV